MSKRTTTKSMSKTTTPTTMYMSKAATTMSRTAEHEHRLGVVASTATTKKSIDVNDNSNNVAHRKREHRLGVFASATTGKKSIDVKGSNNKVAHRWGAMLSTTTSKHSVGVENNSKDAHRWLALPPSAMRKEIGKTNDVDVESFESRYASAVGRSSGKIVQRIRKRST
jgi:hypothetical protein